MTGPTEHQSPRALPGVIPIFPLAGALLLPGGRLPLNIFEPRYLAMVDDALKSHRLIGMIQPESEAEARRSAPNLADVGCVGRIAKFIETDDGRYLIELSGVARFRSAAEISATTPYRQCQADYSPFGMDSNPREGEDEVDRAQVLRTFRAFAETKGLDVDWESAKSAPSGVLVDALAMMSPFGLREKQALLEAVNVKSRADVLVAVATFAMACDDDAPSLLQ